MSWPIPIFTKIEYPRPIRWRVWLTVLVALASMAVAAVLLLWPKNGPSNTFIFWTALIGAPLVLCLLVGGWRVDRWENEQTDAEEAEQEQHRLNEIWREWSQRRLLVADVAAFPAATDEIADFAKEMIELPTKSERAVTFDWAKGRGVAFRRTRLLHLIVRRFADRLASRKEVVVTLMLDEASLKQAGQWARQLTRIVGVVVPGVAVRIEAQSATDAVRWITGQIDRIGPATRLLIVGQLWPDRREQTNSPFSEAVAAFLLDHTAAKAGAIMRPMACTSESLATGMAQIAQYQLALDPLQGLWTTRCSGDAGIVKSGASERFRETLPARPLDEWLGVPGPVSGWIGLAIAMEAMRGAGPQMVAWREPSSDFLSLCTVFPPPKDKE